jgi:hypothetical protein
MDSPNMAPQKTSRQLLTSNLKFLFVAGGGLFGDGYLNTTIGLGTLYTNFYNGTSKAEPIQWFL